MKNNSKPWLYGPNWQGQRCEALTRRGSLCKRPGNKKNGRCKFHGGYSSGPKTQDGIDRLIASKIKHGRFIKEKRDEAKRKAKVGREITSELKTIESWAIDSGNLPANWRDQFN